MAIIATRFEKFHAENPIVFETLCRLAREWIAQHGKHKIGIAMLYEVARWSISFETNDPEFLLNNDFRAYYARLMMFEYPEFDGIFDMRTSEADWWIAAKIREADRKKLA